MKHVTKLFNNGRSQAVRLPKEFRFDEKEVFIWKEDNRIILSPKPKSWHKFFKDFPLASDDFMSERQDLQPQGREGIFKMSGGVTCFCRRRV
jgi:antitoxin VapB